MPTPPSPELEAFHAGIAELFRVQAEEVSVRRRFKFWPSKEVNFIKAKDGAHVSLFQERIDVKGGDHSSSVEGAVVLAKINWGGGVAEGTRAFQISAVAYGIAHKIPIQPTATFSQDEKLKVYEMAKQITEQHKVNPYRPDVAKVQAVPRHWARFVAA